jgi:hypothetical protein
MVKLVRAMHPEDDGWLWMLLLTATSAPFVLFSRFATEITALAPVLIFGGLRALQLGWFGTTARARVAWSACGGALLGLAVYNHMAAAGNVAGICVGLVVYQGWHLGWRCLTDTRGYAFLAGLSLGVLPRILQIVNLGGRQQGPLGRLAETWSTGPAADLAHLPGLLLGMVDGDLLYQRFVGGSLLWVMPTFSGALLLLVLLRGYLGAFRVQSGYVALATGLLVSVAFTTLIAPTLALRYFEVPVLLMLYCLVRLAKSCQVSARLQSRPALVQRAVTLLLSCVVVSQVVYVTVNYFYAHRTTGGQVSVFALGTRLKETSNHFIRSDRLYAELVARNVRAVFADNLVRWPLDYYDGERATLETAEIWELERIVVPNDALSAIVAYNGPTSYSGKEVVDLSARGELFIGNSRFTRATGFDAHFLVWLHDPRP